MKFSRWSFSLPAPNSVPRKTGSSTFSRVMCCWQRFGREVWLPVSYRQVYLLGFEGDREDNLQKNRCRRLTCCDEYLKNSVLSKKELQRHYHYHFCLSSRRQEMQNCMWSLSRSAHCPGMEKQNDAWLRDLGLTVVGLESVARGSLSISLIESRIV